LPRFLGVNVKPPAFFQGRIDPLDYLLCNRQVFNVFFAYNPVERANVNVKRGCC
jgi:hypothetical protein